ncbi:UTP--glucose-1-phosphate uridylyltransferase [Halobacteriales archaeon QS_5_68_33]|nr:MAG: UTP--glucose-1-phosphate uridylyltransferase [Halobacteriales archaeon QS_5_68_33]
MNVDKAVIPAGGYGTRFLPVTKAQPKEMMPVLDRPTIQYVVEEAVEAGIDDILVITGRGKNAIEDHFDRSYELEAELEKSGKDDRLERVREITDLADIHYIRQQDRAGLGAAVQYAEDHVGDEPFALLLGDNFIESSTPSIENLVDVAEDREESVVALERIPWEEVPAYGIADVADTSGRSYPVDDLVEKPTREAAPSNLAIIGRYVFTPEIFDRLDETERSARGELELTDAMRELSAIRGTEIEGDRYHIGTVPDWLEANIRMALRHDDGQLNETVRRTIEDELDRGNGGV